MKRGQEGGGGRASPVLAVEGRALLMRQEMLLAAFLRREGLKAELLLLLGFVACFEAV